MASWSVHFACVVVYVEASFLEVLVREQDFLCLWKEQPGLAEAKDDCSPLVGLQPKGQVRKKTMARNSLRTRPPCVDMLAADGDGRRISFVSIPCHTLMLLARASALVLVTAVSREQVR